MWLCFWREPWRDGLFWAHPVFYVSFLRSVAAGLPLIPARELPVLTELMSLLENCLCFFSFWICVIPKYRQAFRVSSLCFIAAVAAGIRESKLLRCLIYLCLSYFVEILVFFLASQRVAGFVFAAVSRRVKTPSGIRWRMSPRIEMRRFYLSNFHMSGVNSQSAQTNRSCHCSIIQIWCIYSSSTKESRPPCIMNH